MRLCCSETVEDFRDEIDIVVPAMQLLAELLPVMIEDLWKRKMVHTIMDTIQFYAPPPCENRPRVIQRLIPTSEENEEMLMSDEDTLSKALNTEWRDEYAALAAEIAEEIAAGGARKRRKKKYKDNSNKGSTNGMISGGCVDDNTVESGNNSLPRGNLKSSGREGTCTVSFKIEGNASLDTCETVDGSEVAPAKSLSRQNSRMRASFSRAPVASRSGVGATTAVSVPLVSFSKNSFHSGVFQSSEFNLSSMLSPTPKTWGSEFISRR